MKVIELSTDGEGKNLVDLDSAIITFITKWNAQAACWALDMVDSEEVAILSGLMLIPGIDLLTPYQQQKELYGALVVAEQYDDNYQDPELLGTQVKLLWFPVGEEVTYP